MTERRRHPHDSGVFRGVQVPDRGEILSMIAHDMRSPLFAIVGAAELLDDPITGPLDNEQRHLLSLLRRSAERLRSLSADLAELGAAGKGVLELELREESLGVLVRMAVEESCLLDDAVGKDIAIDLRGATDVCVDPARMGRALINLLGNALRHCRSGVWISVRRVDESIAVIVEDDGEGVPDDMLPILFEPFARGSGGHTGLGLAIVREIVRAHGGHVSVSRSEAHGGAAFSLSVPLGRGCGNAIGR